VGIDPPYKDIRFGKFTGNGTLQNWYSKLNVYYGVRGTSRLFFKMHGKSKTSNSPEKALAELKIGLRDEKKAYIYHCHNHYFLIIGYESNPNLPIEAYLPKEELTDTEEWIVIGEISKRYAPFHVKKWSDIVLDLDQQHPKYFNIRHPEHGIMVKEVKDTTKSKKIGSNLHCIIEFSAE